MRQFMQVVAILIFVLTSIPCFAGKLSDTRDATSGNSGSSSSSSSSSSDDDDDDDDSVAGSIIGAILKGIFSSDEDDDGYTHTPRARKPSPTRHAAFLPYPYARGEEGNMVVVTTAPDEDLSLEDRKRFMGINPFCGRLTAGYSYDFSNIQIPSVGALIDFGGFGFETDWKFAIEDLGDSYDTMAIGDVNLVFRPTKFPKSDIYLGVGARIMTSPRSNWSDAGLNTTFFWDIFPVKPLVISMGTDLSLFFDDSDDPPIFFHGYATLGATLKHGEAYAGYEAMITFGKNDMTVPIHGPTTGLRLWF